MSARVLDIDIAFLPLLNRTVDIKRLTVSGVDLTVSRDPSGAWNFQPVADIVLVPSDEKLAFIMRDFNIRDARIHYIDSYSKQNALERRFYYGNVSIVNVRGGCYEINLSGRGDDERSGTIELYVYYDSDKKSASGHVKAYTQRLAEYWDYYLDDMFKPWRLQAKSVVIDTQFSYGAGRLSLEGMYSIDDGILSYGDLSVKCDTEVNHSIKYVKDSPGDTIARIKASVRDISSSTGQYVFLEDARCTAYITDKEIFVRNLTGLVLKQPVSLGGIFFFGPKKLYAHGKAASIDNKLYLRALSEDKGVIAWRAGYCNSGVRAEVNFASLRNMAFDSVYSCDIRLADMAGLFKCLNKTNLSGDIKLAGKLKGELDKPSSLNGEAELKVKDLSILRIQPISFDFTSYIKEGLFSGAVPKTNLHSGDFYGSIKADAKRWGLELHIDKLDLEEFFKSELEIEGVKGVFDMNLACACDWKDIKSLNGGGFIKIADCDMRNTPIFRSTEEGIRGISKEFLMPAFTKIAANFDITDNSISTDKIICESVTMNLNINGEYDFNGDLDCNVGVRFLSKGFLGAARIVLMPETLGFDLLTSTINVKITGKWPGDLKHETQVQPIAWMTNLFDHKANPVPDKYTLDKVWGPG
jgi:hypothetical protein